MYCSVLALTYIPIALFQKSLYFLSVIITFKRNIFIDLQGPIQNQINPYKSNRTLLKMSKASQINNYY
jgi:hypothetical protein